MDSKISKPLSPQEKRKLRKLKLRLKHLTEEFNEAEVLKLEYEFEFQQMAAKLRVALGIDKPSPKSPEPSPEPSDISQNFDTEFKKEKSKSSQPPPPEDKNEQVEEEVRKEIENTASSAPAWMRRVYKQIAMQTHPDKVERMSDLSIFEKAQRVRQFSKARKALGEKDGSTLLQISEELNIEADVDVKMKIQMMTSKAESLQNMVRKIYRSPPWIWGESYGNDPVRVKLLEGYCKILKYQVPDKDFLQNFVKSLEE